MSQYAFKVGSTTTLDLRISAGRLDIVSSSDGTATIDISGSGTEYIVVEQSGDVITLREERHLFGGRTVNIRAAVPAGTNLEAAVASLDVVSRVDLGRVSGRTASGDFDLGKVGSLEIRTASGDVKVDACAGRCEISSASGDLQLHIAEGDVVVATASGDVSVERIMGRLETKTASGDISVRCCAGQQVEATSLSGDISLGIPEGTRVEAEIDSLSGDVSLPPRRPPSGDSSRQMRLRAKTVSGDIDVRRVSPPSAY
jgi:hypothetical protein